MKERTNEKQTEQSAAGSIDNYRLFYVEAIMSDSSFPKIHKIKPIFENITEDEFINMVEKTMSSDDPEVVQQFLYFLILFREMKHLQNYINSPRINIQLIEKLVLFTYGYCTVHDYSTERIIDEILFFIDTERLLELVLYSRHIAHDKLLLFFILSKFDVTMLNKYFATIKNIPEFVRYFVTLPEDVLRSMVSRNYRLFQYIMLMMGEADEDMGVSNDFFSKYKDDIEQFSRLNDLIRKYREEIGKKDSLHERDSTQRISLLVNMIKEMPDPVKAVEYFEGENIFMDDFEKKIVYAIVTDPLLKNIFTHYDTMFEVK
jgi:hypothetical protein